MMDRNIEEPTGWMGLWLNRTHPELYNYSTLAYASLTLAAFIISFKSLFQLRRTRTELLANPSSRQAIMSVSNNKMLSLNRSQFGIATLYLFCTLVIIAVDTYISMSIIWNDASDNPTVYDSAHILELAVYMVGLFAIFSAIFFLFPLLQVMVCFMLIQRRRERSNETAADVISSLRILTTHTGQIWSSLALIMQAYWPTFQNATARMLVSQAVLGSAMMWLQLSLTLNFSSQKLEIDSDEEVQSFLGGPGAITKYGTQIFTRSTVEGLPMYESVAQTERLDEKTEA